MSDGNGRWAISSFSPTHRCRIVRCDRWKKCFTYSSNPRRRMNPNPVLGVFFHWLGGLASASFYVPYRAIRRWSWEIFWITGGVFSWLIAPWTIAALNTKDLFALLAGTQPSTLFWCWFWGAMWGFGGLT